MVGFRYVDIMVSISWIEYDGSMMIRILVWLLEWYWLNG